MIKLIRAQYCGLQDAREPFELWTLLEPLNEQHPIYSTVSRHTIERAGYSIRPVERKELRA